MTTTTNTMITGISIPRPVVTKGRIRAVTIPCNPTQINPKAKENKDASHCTIRISPEKVNPRRKINPCTRLAIREIKANQDSSGGESGGFWARRIGAIDQRANKFTDHFRFRLVRLMAIMLQCSILIIAETDT